MRGSKERKAITISTRRRGAPRGNANALKHGKRTRQRRILYAEIRAHIFNGRALIAAIEEMNLFV